MPRPATPFIDILGFLVFQQARRFSHRGLREHREKINSNHFFSVPCAPCVAETEFDLVFVAAERR
jgi:hypothetical protein